MSENIIPQHFHDILCEVERGTDGMHDLDVLAATPEQHALYVKAQTALASLFTNAAVAALKPGDKGAMDALTTVADTLEALGPIIDEIVYGKSEPVLPTLEIRPDWQGGHYGIYPLD